MCVHSSIHLASNLFGICYVSGFISYFKKMISKDLRIRRAETSPITRPGGNHKNQVTVVGRGLVISRFGRTWKPGLAASNCMP